MQVLAAFDLVLFGGTGDLALRKLLPALYRRVAAGQLSADSRIIGVARSDMSQEEYLAQVEATCRSHVGKEFEDKVWQQFAKLVAYCKVDANVDADFARLSEFFKERDGHCRAFFLSTAPDL
ncbi:MAG TPA: hypothetical protein VKB34_19240, partial [Povalibacter sp.]|nr:hypothetical protein [Povalibacter sp.]